jgi:hypothetical protein
MKDPKTRSPPNFETGSSNITRYTDMLGLILELHKNLTEKIRSYCIGQGIPIFFFPRVKNIFPLDVRAKKHLLVLFFGN